MFTRSHRIRGIASALVVALLVGVGVWQRSRSTDAARPLETDELLSIFYYTWVGMAPDGEMRKVAHVDDLHATERPGLRHLALGAYAAVGRWPEPNNHIINSLAMNAAFALGGATERSARMGALVGAGVCVVALFWLCRVTLGLGAVAYLAAVWMWFLPYTIRFSLTARGYSWMLALATLHVILARRAFERPRDVGRQAAMMLVGLATIINTVSMATDWVFPFYLSLYIVGAGTIDGAGSASAHLREWRRSLRLQSAVLLAIAGAFFLPHLPSALSAAGQYGLFFNGAKQFTTILAEVAAYHFPARGWMALGIVGLAGLVAMTRSTSARWFGIAALTVMGVDVASYALAGRFPYERATGHVIPLVIVGAAYAVHALAAGGVRRRALMLAAGLATVALVTRTERPRLEHPRLTALITLATSMQEPAGGYATFVPTRSTDDLMMQFYAPRSWNSIDRLEPGRAVRLQYFTQPRTASGPTLLKQHLGRTVDFGPALTITPGSFVLWYFDVGRTGINSAAQFAFLDAEKQTYWSQFRRVQLKLTVFGVHDGAMMAVDDQAAYDACRTSVLEGLRRFGGSAVVFLADRVSEHALPD